MRPSRVASELRPDLAAFGNLEGVVELKGLFPVMPGVRLVAGCAVGVSQAVTRPGLLVRVADLAGRTERGQVRVGGVSLVRLAA